MKRNSLNTFLIIGALVGVFTLAVPATTFAHVTVKPSTGLPAAYQTFTTSVPNEKEIPVTEIRLVIPSEIGSVTPTVKQGWAISTEKSGDKVTEIVWRGGTIDAGLRDEFTFSAQLPAKESEVIWKAYQTYQDGSVVSWDQKPADDHGHESEDETKGPYSVTSVKEAKEESPQPASSSSDNLPYVISGVAVLLSALALTRASKK